MWTQTHLEAVTCAGSVRLKMDVASDPLPGLCTAFTTWHSQDWCMLSIILSASSIICNGCQNESIFFWAQLHLLLKTSILYGLRTRNLSCSRQNPEFLLMWSTNRPGVATTMSAKLRLMPPLKEISDRFWKVLYIDQVLIQYSWFFLSQSCKF